MQRTKDDILPVMYTSFGSNLIALVAPRPTLHSIMCINIRYDEPLIQNSATNLENNQADQLQRLERKIAKPQMLRAIPLN